MKVPPRSNPVVLIPSKQSNHRTESTKTNDKKIEISASVNLSPKSQDAKEKKVFRTSSHLIMKNKLRFSSNFSKRKNLQVPQFSK